MDLVKSGGSAPSAIGVPGGSNILMEALGPIPSDDQLIERLSHKPGLPKGVASMPYYELPYAAEVISDLRIPCPGGVNVARVADQMLREGLRRRDLLNASTWRMLHTGLKGAAPSQSGNGAYAAEVPVPDVKSAGLAAALLDPSGAGKTQAITCALLRYPEKVWHPRFPRTVGGLHQLVYLIVEVPASGKLYDLTMRAVERTALVLEDRGLLEMLKPDKRKPEESFWNWVRFVRSRFLGLLVLEESENLFKLTPLKERRGGRRPEDVQLRIADDELLKCLMGFVNQAGIPLWLVGTPDAQAFLEKRFSISQRLGAGGLYHLGYSKSVDCPNFQQLTRGVAPYQWSDKLLPLEIIREVTFPYTAGIRRLQINLHIQAHRIMAMRRERILTQEHFELAANGPLSMARRAAAALLSGRPDSLRQYEDLVAAADASSLGL